MKHVHFTVFKWGDVHCTVYSTVQCTSIQSEISFVQWTGKYNFQYYLQGKIPPLLINYTRAMRRGGIYIQNWNRIPRTIASPPSQFNAQDFSFPSWGRGAFYNSPKIKEAYTTGRPQCFTQLKVLCNRKGKGGA